MGDISPDPRVGWPQIYEHVTCEGFGFKSCRFSDPNKLNVLFVQLEFDNDGAQTRFAKTGLEETSAEIFGDQNIIDVRESRKRFSLSNTNKSKNAKVEAIEMYGRRWLKKRGGDVLIWGEVSQNTQQTHLRFLTEKPIWVKKTDQILNVVSLPFKGSTSSEEFKRLVRSALITQLLLASESDDTLQLTPRARFKLGALAKALPQMDAEFRGGRFDCGCLSIYRKGLFHLMENYWRLNLDNLDDPNNDKWAKIAYEFETWYLEKFPGEESYEAHLYRAHAMFHRAIDLSDFSSIILKKISRSEFEEMKRPFKRAYDEFQVGLAVAETGMEREAYASWLITSIEPLKIGRLAAALLNDESWDDGEALLKMAKTHEKIAEVWRETGNAVGELEARFAAGNLYFGAVDILKPTNRGELLDRAERNLGKAVAIGDELAAKTDRKLGYRESILARIWLVDIAWRKITFTLFDERGAVDKATMERFIDQAESALKKISDGVKHGKQIGDARYVAEMLMNSARVRVKLAYLLRVRSGKSQALKAVDKALVEANEAYAICTKLDKAASCTEEAKQTIATVKTFKEAISTMEVMQAKYDGSYTSALNAAFSNPGRGALTYPAVFALDPAAVIRHADAALSASEIEAVIEIGASNALERTLYGQSR